MQDNHKRWTLLIGANVLCWCVLSFYQATDAAPRTTNQPFANSVEQRAEMVAQLKEINAQLKAQTAILQSGSLKVIVVEQNRR